MNGSHILVLCTLASSVLFGCNPPETASPPSSSDNLYAEFALYYQNSLYSSLDAEDYGAIQATFVILPPRGTPSPPEPIPDALFQIAKPSPYPEDPIYGWSEVNERLSYPSRMLWAARFSEDSGQRATFLDLALEDMARLWASLPEDSEARVAIQMVAFQLVLAARMEGYSPPPIIPEGFLP